MFEYSSFRVFDNRLHNELFNAFNALYTLFSSSHPRLNPTLRPLCALKHAPPLPATPLMPRRERYCNPKLVLLDGPLMVTHITRDNVFNSFKRDNAHQLTFFVYTQNANVNFHL